MRLVEIRLTGIPLALHARTSEHSDEVLREFAHLLDGSGVSHAPARLIALDRNLQERFSGFTEAQSAELEEAMARGEESFDVTFEVPEEVGPAARALAELWDEVDRYCEEGEYLLTLASDQETITYRRWILGEFERQVGGAQPLRWSAFSELASPAADPPAPVRPH